MNEITTSQVSDILENFKALNIQLIDVAALTPLFDHIFICTATSKRHAKSMADQLIRQFKSQLPQTPKSEGLEDCEWVLIDLNNIVVHIMLEETRQFYRLEQLWSSE